MRELVRFPLGQLSRERAQSFQRSFFSGFAGRTGAGACTCACALAFFSASQAWNCLNNASFSESDCTFAPAGACPKNSSNLSRATGWIPCWSSHCCEAGKRCQPASGADSETSFHFGWNGGFWKVGNLVKKASTNCDSFRYRSVLGAQL